MRPPHSGGSAVTVEPWPGQTRRGGRRGCRPGGGPPGPDRTVHLAGAGPVHLSAGRVTVSGRRRPRAAGRPRPGSRRPPVVNFNDTGSVTVRSDRVLDRRRGAAGASDITDSIMIMAALPVRRSG
eukprot:371180-Hanusia_phi.AAC.1